MIDGAVHTLMLSLLPLGALLAAVWDLATFQIPNWLSFLLLVAFAGVSLWAGVPLAAIGWGLLTGLAVLCVTFGLFALGWYGGGDAKLTAALACWFGFENLVSFLLLTTLLGGALAAGILAIRALPRLPPSGAVSSWLGRYQDPGCGVPYGAALGAAAVALYHQTPAWLNLTAPV